MSHRASVVWITNVDFVSETSRDTVPAWLSFPSPRALLCAPRLSPSLPALSAGYFAFYVLTGVSVKYFQGDKALGYPGLQDGTFLVYSTLGGSALCVSICLALGWFRLSSGQRISVLGMSVPAELAALGPSGLCAAVIIPATTLLYSLPISVMVAMVMMRGSIIIVSRAVDGVLILQGLRKTSVRLEENVAVVFALGALAVPLFESDALRLSGAAVGIRVLRQRVRGAFVSNEPLQADRSRGCARG